MGSALNCLFTIIALPLGVALLGYGLSLLLKGEGDAGVFLLILGAMLTGSVSWGLWDAKRRQKAAPRPRSRK